MLQPPKLGGLPVAFAQRLTSWGVRIRFRRVPGTVPADRFPLRVIGSAHERHPAMDVPERPSVISIPFAGVAGECHGAAIGVDGRCRGRGCAGGKLDSLVRVLTSARDVAGKK